MSARPLHLQPRFAAAVQAGTQTRTLLPPAIHPIHPGHILSLRATLEGRARLLCRATVLRVRHVWISPASHIWVDDILLRTGDLVQQFCAACGFADLADLLQWCRDHHKLPFQPLLIQWEPQPQQPKT